MIAAFQKSFILQHDQSDCGVACLSSIIRYHGGNASLETLRELSGTSIQGTTLLGLYQAAKQLGFEAEGLEAESVDNLKELKEPVILHVFIDNRLQHYVVFYGFENDQVVIGDPAKGVILLTKEELDQIWPSKALLKLVPTADFIKTERKISEKRQWLLGLIREDHNLLLIAFVLGVAIAAMGLSTAIFSQKLIDDMLPKGNSTKLIVSLILVTLLLVARAGLGYLRGFLMLQQGMDFNNRIIATFYSALLYLPKSFFDNRKTGELIARMNDTRRIQTVISSLTGSLLIDLLLVIVSLIFVCAYSWMVALILFIGMILVAMLAAFLNPEIIQAQKEVMSSYALTEGHYVDSIQGISSIKSNQREVFFERLNKTIYGAFQTKIVSLGKLGIRFGLLSEVINTVIIMGVFGMTSWMVLRKQLQLGEMVALLGMASNVLPSVTRLAIANIQIQEARVAFDRMYEFTSIQPEETHRETDEATPQPVFEHGIHMAVKHLSFRFPGRPPILKEVSLSVKKGEWIALLGESGGGKSTLLQVLQKFYSPQAGHIEINELPFESIRVKEWRSAIGVVPQDVKIFNGTLLYNITLSDQPSDYEHALTFCRQHGFDRSFSSFPQGYLTLIGEEGINLSGGQKQLVALARALFKKPKLLLLDEATSAMDHLTENFVLELLIRLKPEMGILLITHRIKTAQRADHIYTLQNGVTTSGIGSWQY